MISKGADPENWTGEDEQRDESSGRESLAMRIKPDELKRLYALNPLRSLAAITGTWALIIASISIALASRNPIAWAAAAIIVGRSQHALAVLMHDAAHFRLLENRRLNDFAGQWLCGFPIASNLHAYRKVHLRHHRHLLTDRDPDLSLSRPYPVTWTSFRRKLVRDATGVSSLVMRGYLLVDEQGNSRLSLGRFGRWPGLGVIARCGLAAAIIGALFYAGLGFAFLALWLAPLLTVYQVLLRIRGVLEHGAVPDESDGLRNARTIIATNPFLHFLFNPHHVAYHLEHHLYPAVPHYNLPRLHAVLARDSRFTRALVEHSYSKAMRDLVKPGGAIAKTA